MKSPYYLKPSTNKAQYCFSGERAVSTCQSNYHFAPFSHTDTELLLAWPINSENQEKRKYSERYANISNVLLDFPTAIFV